MTDGVSDAFRQVKQCSTNQNILRKIGLKGSGSGRRESKYIICWPDGSYRWIFSLRGGRPGYLAFYHGTGLRARLLEVLVVLMCLGSRFLSLRVRRAKFGVMDNGILFDALTYLNADDWDAFAGSPGKKRNIVISLFREFDLVGYLKMPLNVGTKNNGTNIELEIYNDIALLELDHIVIPEVEGLSDAVLLSPLRGEKYTKGSIEIVTRALSEIAGKSSSTVSIETYLADERIVVRFDRLMDRNSEDSRVSREAVVVIAGQMLQKLASLDRSREITTTFGIVDFTPWNSFIVGNSVGLIDVEFASSGVSLGYDLIHFHVQDWIMSGKRSSVQAIRNRTERELIPLICTTFGVSSSEANSYVDLYTIRNTLNALELYVDQRRLHAQGLAQIALWQDCSELWMTESP